MPVELKVPTVGESITEVQIGAWHKSVGERVARDEPVAELESEKATFDLPAPEAGVVVKILKQAGEIAKVGEVIGLFDPAGAATESATPPALANSPRPAATGAEPQAKVMPAAARALAERGLTAGEVAATGPSGRLLKEDVLAHASAQTSAAAPAKPQATAVVFRTEEIVPMSLLRRKIAERLVAAQSTAALLTTFNEIDMAAAAALRAKYKDAFQERHGVKLGYMSFFVKAAVDALRGTPQINAEIRGTDIVYRNYCDIGVAVGGGKGLVVPVLRNAERLSFAEIELAVADFGRRARENQLKVDELQGGTFTVSNGGVYGSLLSTPIVNPPQSGVLGMHAIQDRPVAVGGQVVIRPMMYVALTYDHRVVDGREAVLFLKRIKDVIEDPARLFLEI